MLNSDSLQQLEAVPQNPASVIYCQWITDVWGTAPSKLLDPPLNVRWYVCVWVEGSWSMKFLSWKWLFLGEISKPWKFYSRKNCALSDKSMTFCTWFVHLMKCIWYIEPSQIWPLVTFLTNPTYTNSHFYYDVIVTLLKMI